VDFQNVYQICAQEVKREVEIAIHNSVYRFRFFRHCSLASDYEKKNTWSSIPQNWLRQLKDFRMT